MVKKIKFPLEMAGNVPVRTLEELREHFDLERTLTYYVDGKLYAWLLDRYYEYEAEKIKELDPKEEKVCQQLCKILGTACEEDSRVNIDELKSKRKRFEMLKEYTDDEYIMQNIDNIAFNQEDLAKLLDEDKKEIFLCGKHFSIPLWKEGVHYIGVNTPSVSVKNSSSDEFAAKGIILENVDLKESIKSEMKDLNAAQYMRNLKRDSFEYVDEYEQRINQMNAFICGVIFVKREDYNIKTSQFKVNLTWRNCLNQSIKEKLPQDGFCLTVNRDNAKSIFFAGVFHSVYVKFLAIGERLFMKNIYIVVNETVYEIDYEEVNKTGFSSAKFAKQIVSSGNYAYGLNLI